MQQRDGFNIVVRSFFLKHINLLYNKSYQLYQLDLNMAMSFLIKLKSGKFQRFKNLIQVRIIM